MAANPALLYLDLLGVRAVWHRTGAAGAERAFGRLRDLVTEVLKTSESIDHVTSGGVESDSVAIVCDSAEVAIRIGTEIFVTGFLKTPREDERPIWLRGAVVHYRDAAALRTESSLGPGLEKVRRYDYESALLEAISVERAGIKGMRLVVEGDLVSFDLQEAIQVEFSGVKVDRVTPLPFTKYPGRLKEAYQDVLWMADPGRFDELKAMMVSRLLNAVAIEESDEEFAQAAATQAIFHECVNHIESTGG